MFIFDNFPCLYITN